MMFTSHSFSIFFNTFTRSLSFLLAYNTYISFPRFLFLLFFVLFSCEYCLYLGKRNPLSSYTPSFFEHGLHIRFFLHAGGKVEASVVVVFLSI